MTVSPAPIETVVNISDCDSSVYNGTTYFANTSFYADSILNVAGCLVSYNNINITINNSTITNVSESICSGDSLFLGGAWQTTAGIYNDTFMSINTCDSIISTTLVVGAGGFTQIDTSICYGDSIYLENAWQNTSGIYYDTISSGGSGGTSTDTLYTETFDGAITWTLNTSTGANGSFANLWAINDGEGGVAPSGCGVGFNGNNTLHLTNVFGATGAAYYAGGLGGAVTNKSSNSANISTLGYTNIVLTFDFIGNGDALLDNASVLYSPDGGTTWNIVDNSLKSPLCGSGQGQWTAASYTLPVNAENISNLQIRFNWTNNDDAMGTDPSVAINDVRISGDITSTSTGCDSIVETTLTVSPAPIIITTNVCTNISSDVGVVNDTIFTMSLACDSVYTITNTYLVTPVSNITTICTNDPSQAGADTTIVYSVGACDSIYNITNALYQNIQNISLPDEEICEGELVDVFGQNQNTEGTYTNTLTSTLGCDSVIQSIDLIVNSLPDIYLGNDETVNLGNSITLTAEGGDTYVWNTGEINQVISITPTETSTYFVTGTDVNGCENYDTIVVSIIIEEVELMIPTGFTPNGDELNDIFRIVNEEYFKDISLQVYNRWGELIFQSTETVTGWDGTYKTINQEMDVYIYYIDVTEKATDKQISISGTISLIR